MEKYIEVIKKCALFRNINDENFVNLLSCLDSNVKTVKENEYIFLAGDKVNQVGIVLEGAVEVMKENLAGNKHIVAFLEPSDMFAEGIVCTISRISPVTVRAREVSKVLCIPYERITKSCGNVCSYHISLIQNMMAVLGEKNVNLNYKLELLTLKGMREKIASFLIKEAKNKGASIFNLLLNRTEMADYLNVSRTSMCRELARMKEEGLIDYYGNSFKILDREGLVECLS